MADQPNILLITADHMNWDAVCGRSLCRTPRLNRLAEDGISFRRSYTPVSLASPARAMLLSGAFPWHNGVYGQVDGFEVVHRDLRPDAVTYSQRLAEAGYQLAYLGRWQASYERAPIDFGYHQMRQVGPLGPECRERLGLGDDLESARGEPDSWLISEPRYITWPGGDTFMLWGCAVGELADTPEHALVQDAKAVLGELAGGGQPWLCEVHFPQPDHPYTPLREFLDHYPINRVELPFSYYLETFAGKPALLRREAELWSSLSEYDFRDGLRHYYAQCEQVDHFIGEVLDTLTELGCAENTMVVFTSLHGELVGAHRCFIRGGQPYEDGYRIPLIVRWPGEVPAGVATNGLVQLQDLAHTFIAAAGAAPLPHAGGQDLSPLLRDPREEEQLWPPYLLNVYYGDELLSAQRQLISLRFKYVFNGFDFDELYDLMRDPHELNNVIDHPAYESTRQDLRDGMWELMVRYDDPFQKTRFGAARYLPGPRGGLPRQFDDE